jgi:group I intron endonuclease
MTNDNTNKQDNRIYYLYRITNKINGKIYIGQTVQPEKRWTQHKTSAASDSPRMIISYAIKKYGNDAFEFEVIAGCKTWEDANEIETLLVAQYGSLVPNGYNVSLGGFNAPKSEAWKEAFKKWHASLSPEERAIISKKQSEATFQQIAEKGHPAAGREVSEETRELLRKIRLENPIDYTPEIRQHMSEAHLGIQDTEETKQRKSESAKEAWEKRTDYSRKCAAEGCEVHGKAKYKIIDGVRYCNKHGLRMLRYGRINALS